MNGKIPNQPQEEPPKIITPSFESKGRMGEDVINSSKRFIENLDELKATKEKQAKGEILSSIESTRLREEEIRVRNIKEKNPDEKQGEAMESFIKRQGEQFLETTSAHKAEPANPENEEEIIELTDVVREGHVPKNTENQTEQDTSGNTTENNENQTDTEKIKTELDEARKTYAEEYLKVVGDESKNSNRIKKIRTALGLQVDVEETPELKAKKEKYLIEIKNKRKELYEKAKREIDGKSIPEESKEKLLKEEQKKIAKITVVLEANLLYNQKKDLELETKGGDGTKEKVLKITGRIVDKYRKMPLRKKLLISAGLLCGGVAAGFAGGATGIALATGVVTGKLIQRTLGGAATAVGLEALIKSRQEKRGEKETMKLFNGLKKSIEASNEELDKKLFELEGSKGKQKFSRYTLAGMMGLLVSSGAVAEAAKESIPDFLKDWATEKLGGVVNWTKGVFGDTPPAQTKVEVAENPSVVKGVPAEKLATPTASLSDESAQSEELEIPKEEVLGDQKGELTGGSVAEEAVSDKSIDPKIKNSSVFPNNWSAQENIPGEVANISTKLPEYSIKSGDNLWKILKSKIPEIEKLERPGMKDNAVANLIKEIEKDPKSYGISSDNVDNLKIGDNLNMDKIHELLDEKTIKGEKLIDHAKGLNKEALDKIEAYKATPETGPQETSVEKGTLSTPPTPELDDREIAKLELEKFIDEDVQKAQTDLFKAREDLGIAKQVVDNQLAGNPEEHEIWKNLDNDVDQQNNLVQDLEKKLGETPKNIGELLNKLEDNLIQAMKEQNYSKAIQTNLDLAKADTALGDGEAPFSRFKYAFEITNKIGDNSKKLELLRVILNESMTYRQKEFISFRESLLNKIGEIITKNK